MGIYSTYIPGAGAKFFEIREKFHLERPWQKQKLVSQWRVPL